jgi:ketosteroid isomerase-like protein
MDIPAVVQAYIDAYNHMDVEGMLSCLHPDVHFQNLSQGAVTAETFDRAAFAELARFAVTAFSTRHQSVLHCTCVGDRTMLEIDYRATVAADLPNGWKVGQELRFAGASYFECAQGKIVRLVDQS